MTLNLFINYFFPRGLNKSEFEQNEKLQEIVDKYNIKLKEKEENILKVSCNGKRCSNVFKYKT